VLGAFRRSRRCLRQPRLDRTEIVLGGDAERAQVALYLDAYRVSEFVAAAGDRPEFLDRGGHVLGRRASLTLRDG
jgi:hypothetical protein